MADHELKYGTDVVGTDHTDHIDRMSRGVQRLSRSGGARASFRPYRVTKLSRQRVEAGGKRSK